MLSADCRNCSLRKLRAPAEAQTFLRPMATALAMKLVSRIPSSTDHVAGPAAFPVPPPAIAPVAPDPKAADAPAATEGKRSSKKPASAKKSAKKPAKAAEPEPADEAAEEAGSDAADAEGDAEMKDASASSSSSSSSSSGSSSAKTGGKKGKKASAKKGGAAGDDLPPENPTRKSDRKRRAGQYFLTVCVLMRANAVLFACSGSQRALLYVAFILWLKSLFCGARRGTCGSCR